MMNNFVSNNWSISQETMYATVHSIVINQINAKNGQVYFPLMYTLFVFILMNNLIGMVPYSFASTSHFVLTFSLGFTLVLCAFLLKYLLLEFVFKLTCIFLDHVVVSLGFAFKLETIVL